MFYLPIRLEERLGDGMKEEIIAASGHGKRSYSTQLVYSEGGVVDQLGTADVVVQWNHRIKR